MARLENSTLKDLLQKEAQGTLTPNEKQKLDDWYHEFDKTQKYLKIFRDDEHEAYIKQRLLNRIIEARFEESDTNKNQVKHMWMRWTAIAAVLVIAIAAGLLWIGTNRSTGADKISLSFETGQGQLKKIKLGDGSEVWLNAESKLGVSEHFGQQRRDVYLDGEAYFDVHHDASRPFVVHANHLTTNVLGTAFSVTAYKNSPIQAVTVIRGKVQVAHELHVLGFLTPNKRMEYRIGIDKSLISDVTAASVMSWKDGKLQFENQNMQDIASRLGRWYGYSVSFEHEQIKNCRYTASFNNQIPLRNLLKVMKEISLLNYKIDTAQKTVTFLGTGCNE
jgi:ferric-dicitrate binding protein FerR (iron transport regulator)